MMIPQANNPVSIAAIAIAGGYSFETALQMARDMEARGICEVIGQGDRMAINYTAGHVAKIRSIGTDNLNEWMESGEEGKCRPKMTSSI